MERQGLYLATVIDLGSRRVVGWATADHLLTDLIDQALTNAITSRRPSPGVIFHSDRGCQYTSAKYRRLAEAHGVRLSVGRRGQCSDNAVAESFFSTIKTELLDRRPWSTRAAAHKATFRWIEGWYNTRRRHSTLDYLSPRRLGGQTQPTTRASSGSLTPHRPCPSERVNPSAAGIDIGAGRLTATFGDLRHDRGRVSGALVRVPWARDATKIVVLGDGLLSIVDAARCRVVHGSNLAGEPRDNVIFEHIPAEIASWARQSSCDEPA